MRLHWILELLAVFCLATGVLAVYVNKNRYSKPHFMTWHGCFGLLTLIHSCLQLLAGLLLYWNFTRRYVITPFLSYSKARRYHAISGAMLTVLASLTLFLGLASTWFQRSLSGISTSNQIWAVYILLVILIFWNTLTVVMQVVQRTTIS